MFTVSFYKRDFTSRISTRGLNFQVERFSFVAQGGCSEASLRVVGNATNLLFDLLNYLRAPIEIFDERGQCVWWGYVHSTVIHPPGVGLTLDGFGNRVRVAYSTPTGRATPSARGTTAWVDDATSQALYGIREYTDTLNEIDATTATQRANIVLAQRKYPLPIVELDAEAVPEAYATVTCRGWIDTLDWRNYSRGYLVQYYDSATAKAVFQNFGGVRDLPLWGVQRVGQSITLAYSMYMESITAGIALNGPGPRNLRFRIYSGGLPWSGGTVIAETAQYQQATGIPATGANGLIGFPFLTPAYVAAGTGLWIVAEGDEPSTPAYWQNRWQIMLLEEAGGTAYVEYPAGAWKPRSSTGLAAANLRFDLNGILDTSQLVSEALTTSAEFITAVDVKNTSGIRLPAYRDGESSLWRVLEELLNMGTTNYRRLLLNLTRERVAQVYEESAGSAGNPDLLLDLDGVLYDARKQKQGARSPVAKWVKLIGTPLSDSLSNPPHFFFVERATYNVESDRWELEPRGSDQTFVARIA